VDKTTAPLPSRVRRVIAGIETDVIEIGSGRPLLFLHSGEHPTITRDRYLHAQAKTHGVIAPWHPGLGTTGTIEHVRERARREKLVAAQ
jgi:hypothetical protein